MCSTFGIVLRRETRLCDGAATGPLLAWEESAHDPKGRLLSTAFSDGTALSNIWGCCRLDATVRRDGTRVETWEIPGFPLWSAEAETSLGSLPGLNGCHPVTEIYADALGRVTNTVLSVWSNGSPSSAHARISTTTEYPYGTSDYMVTTDPFGTQTVYFVTLAGSARITTTRTPGVTNSVTQYYGGNTVYESRTTDGIATTTYATAYATNGCRVETVSVVTNGVAVTNIVTEYDFLGNPVVTADPAAAVPESSVSYQQISNIWYRTCVGSVVSNGITNTLFTAVRQLTGLAWPIQQRVTITDTNNETVVVTVSSTSVPAIRTVTRQNLTLGATETTTYLGDYPVYSVDSFGVTNANYYTFNGDCSIVLQSPPNNAIAMLSLNPDFEVATHFVQLKIRLTQELMALCPKESVNSKKNHPCCEPAACRADAEALAALYIAALENAWLQRELANGGFWGSVGLWFWRMNSDWTGDRYPEDLIPGLVCGGWTEMAQSVLGLPTENSDCWNIGSATSRNWFMRLRNMDSHIWATLYVEDKDESVSLDPWPSGGWEY